MIVRLGTLCLLFWLFACPVQAQPKAPLSVEGVTIGMSFSDVLQQRGRPKAVGQEDDFSFFTYAAPAKRPEDTAVWFHQGRVVYCSGYSLESQGEPLFLYGMLGAILQEELGASQTLSVFAQWWPASGVVLAGNNNIWANDPLKSPIALRDPGFPIAWIEGAEGRRWSKREPWLDDETKVWLAEDVELGMAEEQARKLAGTQDILYQGGYVRGVRRAKDVLLSQQVGGQDFSIAFMVGESPESLGSSPSFPHSGWYAPAPLGRVRMASGKVAEVELKLTDDAMFKALQAATATRKGQRAR